MEGLGYYVHMVTNSNNIIIKAPAHRWERIKKAIKNEERIILKDCGQYFVPMNVHDELWKDGKNHTILYNFKRTHFPPDELTLTGKVAKVFLKDQSFDVEVKTITLLQHATETI